MGMARKRKKSTELIYNREVCDDCEYSYSGYGTECCDSAWEEYGIDCATLESEYSWDCSGCNCPGDIQYIPDVKCGGICEIGSDCIHGCWCDYDAYDQDGQGMCTRRRRKIVRRKGGRANTNSRFSGRSQTNPKGKSNK